MSSEIRLTGWQAVIGILVVIGVLAARILSFIDISDDPELMKKVEMAIMTDHFPNDVARLESQYERGDLEATSDAVRSIETSRIHIESAQASYPLFDSASKREVIVKVAYSLKDSEGTRARDTNYYRFENRSIGNTWRFMYETTVVAYYLNFL